MNSDSHDQETKSADTSLSPEPKTNAEQQRSIATSSGSASPSSTSNCALRRRDREESSYNYMQSGSNEYDDVENNDGVGDDDLIEYQRANTSAVIEEGGGYTWAVPAAKSASRTTSVNSRQRSVTVDTRSDFGCDPHVPVRDSPYQNPGGASFSISSPPPSVSKRGTGQPPPPPPPPAAEDAPSVVAEQMTDSSIRRARMRKSEMAAVAQMLEQEMSVDGGTLGDNERSISVFDASATPGDDSGARTAVTSPRAAVDDNDGTAADREDSASPWTSTSYILTRDQRELVVAPSMDVAASPADHFPLLLSLPQPAWWSIHTIVTVMMEYLSPVDDCVKNLRLVCSGWHDEVALMLLAYERQLVTCPHPACRRWCVAVGLVSDKHEEKYSLPAAIASHPLEPADSHVIEMQPIDTADDNDSGRHAPFGTAATPTVPQQSMDPQFDVEGELKPIKIAAVKDGPYGVTCSLHTTKHNPMKSIIRRRLKVESTLEQYTTYADALRKDFVLTRVLPQLLPIPLLLLVAAIVVYSPSQWEALSSASTIATGHASLAIIAAVSLVFVPMLMRLVMRQFSRQVKLQHRWKMEQYAHGLLNGTVGAILVLWVGLSNFELEELLRVTDQDPIVAGSCVPLHASTSRSSTTSQYPYQVLFEDPIDWVIDTSDTNLNVPVTIVESGMLYGGIYFSKATDKSTVISIVRRNDNTTKIKDAARPPCPEGTARADRLYASARILHRFDNALKAIVSETASSTAANLHVNIDTNRKFQLPLLWFVLPLEVTLYHLEDVPHLKGPSNFSWEKLLEYGGMMEANASKHLREVHNTTLEERMMYNKNNPLRMQTTNKYFTVGANVNTQLRIQLGWEDFQEKPTWWNDANRSSSSNSSSNGLTLLPPLIIPSDYSQFDGLGDDGVFTLSKQQPFGMLVSGLLIMTASIVILVLGLARTYLQMTHKSLLSHLSRLVIKGFRDHRHPQLMSVLEMDKTLAVASYPPRLVPEESESDDDEDIDHFVSGSDVDAAEFADAPGGGVILHGDRISRKRVPTNLWKIVYPHLHSTKNRSGPGRRSVPGLLVGKSGVTDSPIVVDPTIASNQLLSRARYTKRSLYDKLCGFPSWSGATPQERVDALRQQHTALTNLTSPTGHCECH